MNSVQPQGYRITNENSSNLPNKVQQDSPSRKPRRSIIGSFLNNKSLLVLIVILQIIMIGLIINPIALIQQFQNQQIINEVASLVSVNTSEAPVIATVTDADALRGENAAQAQVYKDAENGDYVVGYSNKMVIYRRTAGEIVYEGENPNTLVQRAQQDLIDRIVQKGKESGVLGDDINENPQLSVVTNANAMRSENADFYANAKNNDIVALFPTERIIVLYNQETNSIVNSGKYSTIIE